MQEIQSAFISHMTCSDKVSNPVNLNFSGQAVLEKNLKRILQFLHFSDYQSMTLDLNKLEFPF
jgi:hypothetical protein